MTETTASFWEKNRVNMDIKRIYNFFDPIVNMRAVLYKNLVKSTVQIGMKGH